MAKKPDKPTDVTIFGEVVDSKKRHFDCRESDTGGGIVLIFGGLLLLLNNLNMVPWSVWQSIFQLWPLAIVLVGVTVLVGNSCPARFFILVINTILLGSLLIYILSVYSPGFVSWVPKSVMKYILYWEVFDI